MSDDTKSLIRTIAETDEIKDLASRALKTSEIVAKENIKIKRVIAAQQGVGDRSANSGAGAGEDDPITTAEGDEVLAPETTPTPNHTGSNTGTTSNPSGHTGSSAGVTQAGAGGQSNDLSGSGQSPGVGGSVAANLAKGGEDDPDWQNMLSAMNELGYSAEQIAMQRISYLETEAGVHEIGDVMQGSVGSHPPFDFSKIIEDPIPGGIQLNAVVGMDPDDTDLAVMIRFDNKQVPPNDKDSEKEGVLWLDENTGVDKTWSLGFEWADGGTGDKYASPADWFARSPANIYLKTVFPDLTLVKVSAGYYYSNSETGGGSFGYCTASGCIPGSSSSCPTSAPEPAFWAKTGLYLLKMAFGETTFSLKDSEVPRDKFGNISGTSVYSKTTGHTYNVEPGINGGVLMYDANSPTYALYYGSDRTLKTIVPAGQIHLYIPRR